MTSYLPPKRFEDYNDPRFDNIRFKPWYAKLIRRRKKIPMIMQAYRGMGCLSQKDAAELFDVDERELRSYCYFVEKNCSPPTKEQQKVLDLAYTAYCANNEDQSLNFFLKRIAPSYGLSSSAIIEKWEVDALFIPSSLKEKE